MRIDVLTLFPELVEAPLRTSITGRALEADIWELHTWQIRDYSGNRYGKVDDRLYGGGTGMLMQCQPIWDAWQAVLQEKPRDRVIFLSPKGRRFDQALARELSQESSLTFLCGHYEGVDQRVLDAMEVEEISLGDFVMTGGEIAAVCMIDATLRMVQGVLPDEDAYRDESHYSGLLEARQYTMPQVWEGRRVPDVLTSGHHANIEAYRHEDALLETLKKRPDLLEHLDESEWKRLAERFGSESTCILPGQ